MRGGNNARCEFLLRGAHGAYGGRGESQQGCRGALPARPLARSASVKREGPAASEERSRGGACAGDVGARLQHAPSRGARASSARDLQRADSQVEESQVVRNVSGKFSDAQDRGRPVLVRLCVFGNGEPVGALLGAGRLSRASADARGARLHTCGPIPGILLAICGALPFRRVGAGLCGTMRGWKVGMRASVFDGGAGRGA